MFSPVQGGASRTPRETPNNIPVKYNPCFTLGFVIPSGLLGNVHSVKLLFPPKERQGADFFPGGCLGIPQGEAGSHWFWREEGFPRAVLASWSRDGTKMRPCCPLVSFSGNWTGSGLSQVAADIE